MIRIHNSILCWINFWLQLSRKKIWIRNSENISLIHIYNFCRPLKQTNKQTNKLTSKCLYFCLRILPHCTRLVLHNVWYQIPLKTFLALSSGIMVVGFQARNICFLFSLIPPYLPLTRRTDTKKSWAVLQFFEYVIKFTVPNVVYHSRGLVFAKLLILFWSVSFTPERIIWGNNI